MSERRQSSRTPRLSSPSRLLGRPFAAVIVLVALLLPIASGAAAEQLRHRLDIDASQLTRWESEGQSHFRLESGRHLRDLGRPQLPFRRYQFLIPRDKQLASVSLVGGVSRPIDPAFSLAVDTGQSVNGGPEVGASVFADGSVAAAGVYPPVRARFSGEQSLHGYQLVAVDVYPLTRDGSSGELTFLEGGELILDLEPRTRPSLVVDRKRDLPDWRERVRSQMRARVANPEAVDGYRMPAPVDVPVAKGEAVGKTPSLTSSPVRYLIVTDENLAGEFQRLADYRSADGLPAVVVTTQEILANYRQGVDLAETIRLYITDAYDKWGVDYVLLGGDSDILPPRYVTSTYYPPSGTTDIPADMYFSCLGGNWNDDGDAIFGEPYVGGADLGDFVDLTPELAVGRATVTLPSQVQTFVDKVLEYEQPTNVGFQSSILFASEVLFPPAWNPEEPFQLDGALYSEDIMGVISGCDTYGDWDFTRYYENYLGYPGSIEETKVAVMAGLQSQNYGMVNHVGHGFYFNMSVGNDNIKVVDADLLTNAPNYFMLYALNCDSAAFDFACLMERFLINPQGGSAMSIGSARAAFPHTAHDYQLAFYDGMFCSNTNRAGDAVNDSRLDFTPETFWNTVDRWTHFVYVLLGDPAMRIWTADPRAIDVSMPASIDVGHSTIVIDVDDQVNATPLPGVSVTLSKDGEDYATAITDISGQVSVSFHAETPGTIDVRVAGSQAYPFDGAIAVGSGVDVELSVASLAAVEDGSGASSGNGNGRLEAGETVELTAMMRNGGGAASAGATLSLTCTDPGVNVLDGAASVGVIAAGGSALAGDPFLLSFDPSISDAQEIHLQIQATEAAVGTFDDVELLSLAASELEIYQLDLDDSAGNGDGIVDAGETVELIFDLKNFGTGAVGSVTATLTSMDSMTTVVDGLATWPGMVGVLDHADNDLDRFVVIESDVSSPIDYRLTLTDDSGRVIGVDFELRRPGQVIGVTPGPSGGTTTNMSWDPGLDPDLRGYRVYGRVKGQPPYEIVSSDILEGTSYFEDTGLPGLTRFEYYVVAVDFGGLESMPSSAVETTTSPPEISCFPLPIGQETSGALAVGHVDPDGVPDVVVGSDHVYVIDGDCNEKLDGDNDSQTFGPISEEDGGFQPSGVAMANLDDDPDQEIVACNWTTKEMFVYDGDGTPLPGWPVLLKDRTWSTPAIDDLDGDGDLEIVVLDTKGWTYCFHHDGTEMADGDDDQTTIGPIAPRRLGEVFGRTSPAFLDVDGDGDKEILHGTKWGNGVDSEKFYAHKIDGSGNAEGWPKVFAPNQPFLASPVIADINDDGIEEIIQFCENDSLYVWEPDGSNLAPFPASYRQQSWERDSQAPCPAVADFNGDGKLEIVLIEVVAQVEARVNILDYQNNLLPGWPVTVPSLSESSPVIGDINGDGSLDVVFGITGSDTAPPRVYAWNQDGTPIDGFPILVDGFVRATPTICDFDQNGTTNIVLASWDKLIHVWDTQATYDPSLVPWPTFRGNLHRDGSAATVVPTSTDEPAPLATRLPLLAPNVPNPFNPSTVLRFTVPGGDEAWTTLDVFDAAGRRVARLVDGPLPPGEHDVRWQGQDGSGRRVVSGVYFARLTVDGHPPHTRKMALVK